jgi:hypothetical protein
MHFWLFDREMQRGLLEINCQPSKSGPACPKRWTRSWVLPTTCAGVGTTWRLTCSAGSIANCGKRRVAIRCACWHHRSIAAGIRRERRIFPDAPEGSLGKNSSTTSLPRGRGTRGSMEHTTTCRLPIFRPSLALRSACPSLRKVTTKINRLIEEEFEQIEAQDRK